MRPASRRWPVVIAVCGLAALLVGPLVLHAQGPVGGKVRLAGGFGGDQGQESHEAPVPTVHLTAPVTAASARTWLKLQKPVPMFFPNETPLEDVLKFVKEQTKGQGETGIPIYVDPVGLQEAEKTLTSPVTMNLDGAPLAFTLRLLLKQLGLIYYVQEDGLLVVTSEDDEDAPIGASEKILDDLDELRNELGLLRRELAGGRDANPARNEQNRAGVPAKKASVRRLSQAGPAEETPSGLAMPPITTVHLARTLTPQAAETWLRLQKSIPCHFPVETPLSEVLDYIRKTTRGEGERPMPIYLDPVGLQEAEKTATSTVILDVEGVPLAKSLRLMLKQVGLRYQVLDEGVLMITSDAGDDEPTDSSAAILDKISALRMEVSMLRRWCDHVGPRRPRGD